MNVVLLLTISVLLQFTAAVLALRLIRITGRRRAWVLIASAILLMAVRRSVTLVSLLAGYSLAPPDVTAEWIALGISLLMVVGVAWIAPVFQSIQKSAAAVRASEEKYRTLIETAGDAIFVADAETGIILDANRRAEALLGMPVDQIVGMHQTQLHPQEQAEQYQKVFQNHTRKREAFSEDLVVCHKDGRRIPVSISASVVEVGGKKVIHGIFRDITERKRAEAALRESEERYRTLFENVPIGIGVADADGNLLAFNRAMLAPGGYTDSDIAEMDNVAQLYCDPDERAKALAITREQGFLRQHEVRFKRKDGSGYDVLLSLTPVKIEGEPCMLAMVEDVTERKQAEAALRENEEKYRGLFDESVAAVYVFDAKKNFVDANQAGLDLLGYTREELLRMSIPDVDADPIVVLPQHEQLLSGERLTGFEHQLKRKDGKIITVLNNSRPLTEAGGNVTGMQSTLIDITERKRAEAALRESEEQFRLVTEGSLAAIVMHQDRKIVYANPKAAASLGYPRDFPVGRDPVEFFHPDDQDAIANIMKAREQGQEVPAHREWRLIGHDGRVLWFDVLATRIIYRGRLAVLATLVDITERKRAEEERKRLEDQLRQSQKMEAIGQLAGGVSHDINNVLTAIFGNVELMQGRMEQMLPPGDPLLGDLAEIERSAEHAATLTRQLLAFSRRQVIRPEVLDPNCILTDMEKMLRRLLREDIDFAMVCAPDVWSIRTDVGQIQQVIMNLVVNAADAMPDGGKLTVETANVMLDEAYVAGHVEAQPGRHVMLAVRDTGCGMDSETLERIFEPFFTTKPVGKGTGLGLATVHGIVAQAGGHITVDSEPGVGTTFRVYLAAAEQAASVAADPQPVEGIPGGRETILVCEDDDLVRQLACQALEGGGYTVLSGENAKRSLELAAEHPGPIHLLVTDVIMPDMNGRQLAEALARTRSEIKVLYISGYTSDVIGQHGMLDAGVEFLAKPFRLPSLLRRVREVLDKTRIASNVS